MKWEQIRVNQQFTNIKFCYIIGARSQSEPALSVDKHSESMINQTHLVCLETL